MKRCQGTVVRSTNIVWWLGLRWTLRSHFMWTVSLSKWPQNVKVSVAVIVVQEKITSTVQKQSLLVSLHKNLLLTKMLSFITAGITYLIFLTAMTTRVFTIIFYQSCCVWSTILILGPISITIVEYVLIVCCPLTTWPGAGRFSVIDW